ncbi:MAG: glutamate--cysteine ligase [Gammaproteobacteria bacterium]|nr:glutamate--cysteine ligase [Gammaproteobacteria bacterium]MDH3750272.1 glutamate--cysteine ligase [Gammaproteobacteria bacterium]MDH3803857.1 glutamate--cysteine ligase [Gammaproteobacteria bacterium]
MSSGFETRLNALVAGARGVLGGGLRGIEKESLRLDMDGYLSRTSHPDRLGSALTNHFVTTDFSEALLEFVTPAFASTWEALRFLCDIHQFAYKHLGEELLWTASMPCRIPTDAEIPLARYGTSNVGRMKTIYRRGLGFRYGRQMQTIAGVHFNYSLPESFWPHYQAIMGDDRNEDEFRSDLYLALVRNFRRFGWLVLYLFGASPAMCKSFAGAGKLDMPSLNAETWYEPFGTSLRMSDLGYSNKNQSRINISLNSLDGYIRDLRNAIRTPEPDYEKIGVKVDGHYRQLSANRLQIENEYYSPIRPKRVARSGERPTAALRRGGIEYVEIRSLDINISDPAGVNQNTMRVIEAFLIYCLLEESPHLDEASCDECTRNQAYTAKQGRNPELRLLRDGNEVTLASWGSEILHKVSAVAELIDGAEGGESYSQAVRSMLDLVEEPAATPSAQLLEELKSAKCSFFDYALSVAQNHRDYFASITPLSKARQEEFEQEAARSIEQQQEIESGDEISLEEYLANYFSSD